MGLLHKECPGTSIIDNLSGETGGIFSKSYVLAWNPSDGLSTYHALIATERTKMLQPSADDDPSITNWPHAQKNLCYKTAVKRVRWQNMGDDEAEYFQYRNNDTWFKRIRTHSKILN